MEKVNTGGNIRFEHGRDSPKISRELEEDIKQGYQQAEKRKFRNKVIGWSIVVLIALIISIYFLAR